METCPTDPESEGRRDALLAGDTAAPSGQVSTWPWPRWSAAPSGQEEEALGPPDVTKETTMWFGAVLAGDLVHPRTPGRVPVAADHGSVRGWGQTSLQVRPSPPDVVPQNVRRATRAPGARAHPEPRHAHARSRTITPRSGRCEDARRAHGAPSDAGWRHLADSMDPGPSRWTASRPGIPTRPPDPATADDGSADAATADPRTRSRATRMAGGEATTKGLLDRVRGDE